MKIPAQDFRTGIFTCTRPGEEKFRLLILSGMTSWIAGPLQQLMRSSPFPWMSLVVLTKISSYRNNNSNNHGKNNYSGKPWQQKNDGKPWQNRENKQWQNRDNKPWQNKDKKSWQNNKSKGDKSHDTCFTLSRDKKFFVPADCDENVFQIICTLVKAQIDKVKQSGGNGKEINEISKDTLVNLLNISGETYDAAQSVVQEVEKSEISSSSSSTD